MLVLIGFIVLLLRFCVKCENKGVSLVLVVFVCVFWWYICFSFFILLSNNGIVSNIYKFCWSVIFGLIFNLFNSEKLINIVVSVIVSVVKKLSMLLDKKVMFIIFIVCVFKFLLVFLSRVVCFWCVW